MKNSKSTKRTLIASIMSLVLCVTMLLGTTLAWFTDTASTAVNKIQAGTLKVDIVKNDDNEASIRGESMNFVDVNGSSEILWEPGVTFKTTGFKIKSTGNLALKYKLELNGVTGDNELLKVIKFSVVNAQGEAVDLDNFEGHLTTAIPSSDVLYIQGHMDESAGNEYQGKTLEELGITVYATQDTVEVDSKDKQYDKNAEYATPVSTVAELQEAVEAGESVVLENDLKVQSALNIASGNNVTIDLNGKNVTTDPNTSFASVSDGTLTLTGGTVTASNNVAKVSGKGAVVIDGGTYESTASNAIYAEKGGKVTVNGGEIKAQECVFAAVDGGEMTINDGTFTAKDNMVIGTNGREKYAGSIITINGGIFNGNIKSANYIACGVYVANDDTVIINGGTFNITDGAGVVMRAGRTTIGKNVVINLTNTGEITSGKVGDSTINISTPSYLVKDTKSNYPGASSEFTVTNNSHYELKVIE